MRDDTDLVIAARTTEPDAFGLLAQRWFDRCWEVAWRILRDRDAAADVAQETLLVAWRQLDRLREPASFGGWVLRIARNRSLDRLQRERRAMPTDDFSTFDSAPADPDAVDPAALLARSEQQQLLWAAAAALGERDASLLDLHLRHGMEPAELAVELGIAPNAAHQAMFRLRRRLGAAIRAWLVWRNGEPSCLVLRAELAAAGIDRFGAAAVRLLERHAETCDDCADERRRVTAPVALFSAVPFVVVPAGVRTAALEGLASAGVPLGALDPDHDLGPHHDLDPDPAERAAGAEARPEPPVASTGPADPKAGTPVRTAAMAAAIGAAVIVAAWWLRPAEPELVAGPAPATEPTTATSGPAAQTTGTTAQTTTAAPTTAVADPAQAAATTAGDAPPPAAATSGAPVEGPAGGDDPVVAPPPLQPNATAPLPAIPPPAPAADEPGQPAPPEERPAAPTVTDGSADDPDERGAAEAPAIRPVIDRFIVEALGRCADGTGRVDYRFTWRTTGAEAVSIADGNGVVLARRLDGSGSIDRCAAPSAGFRLTASSGAISVEQDAPVR